MKTLGRLTLCTVNKTYGAEARIYCMVRACMAMPNGSLVLAAVSGGTASSPMRVEARKNTSGLVHVAIARRMWVVKNERPTWYAAGAGKKSATCRTQITEKTYHSSNQIPPEE